MNALDWILILFAVLYALSGYQQGFIVGAASTIGLLAGGFIGVQVTPWLLDGFDPALSVSVAALLVVLACAFVGQAIGVYVGGALRGRLTWQPARVLDACSGAALSVVAMLLIAWVLGVAASGADLRGLNNEVRTSSVLAGVDKALPGGSDRVLSAFNSLVDSSLFPRYLEPFTPEHIKEVPPPNRGVVAKPGVRAAEDSVVKILGAADSCGRSLEGTGFVYRPGRVMTNAHVVAGVDEPTVRIGETDYSGTVVSYDPAVDVAVIDVPDLPAPALDFASREARSGAPAAVLGFPENGPFDAQPARIRDRRTLRSPDIYGDDTVFRDTYSIRAVVRQGNSGGPLVDARGDVLGVIFAASVTDGDTAYALTARQVSEAALAGASASAGVDTGDCAL